MKDTLSKISLRTYTTLYMFLEELLPQFGCEEDEIVDIVKRWNEPHRHYHNSDHVEGIIKNILSDYDKLASDKLPEASKKNNEHEKLLLLLCAVFHDAVYSIDPAVSSMNEKKSADLFKEYCTVIDEVDRVTVYNAIVDTTISGYFRKPSSDLSAEFQRYDLAGLRGDSLERMIADEKKILKEFGGADYSEYKAVRGQIILKFADAINDPKSHLFSVESAIDYYYDWFMSREIKIAVYPGTFYPLHRGHMDILHKAEKIFDKVILAFGVNPAKQDENYSRKKYMEEDLKKKLPNYQVEMFRTTLTEYIKSKKYPVTIIKGLRNPEDFKAEKTQQRYLEDLDTTINIVYIVCDRVNEHVSSSGIKVLKTFGENTDIYTEI